MPLRRATAWGLHTKFYKIGFSTFLNNARWISAQISILARWFIYQSCFMSQLLDLIYWIVTIFIFDCVTLQTSHYFLYLNDLLLLTLSNDKSIKTKVILRRLLSNALGLDAESEKNVKNFNWKNIFLLPRIIVTAGTAVTLFWRLSVISI